MLRLPAVIIGRLDMRVLRKVGVRLVLLLNMHGIALVIFGLDGELVVVACRGRQRMVLINWTVV